MKIVIALAVVFVFGYLIGTMALSESNEISELVAGNNGLCKNLYNILRKTPGNIFFSPASLEFALTLLYAGAQGKTAEQIKTQLSLPEPKEKAFNSVKATLTSLTETKDVVFNVANGLFVQNDYKLKETFLEAAKKYFSAHVTNVDYRLPSPEKAINEYVAKETNEKITELFAAGSLDALTRLVIVNAIYFKGNWASKFDPTATFKGEFHLNKNDKVTVDFMKQKAHFRVGYPDDLKATVVVLPYSDKQLKMVLVVPNDVDGLASVEEQLPKVDLVKLVNQTYSQEIILTMPKFKFSQGFNLNNNLIQLGMSEMFSEHANLSGITDDPLYVSQVVQKCFIEVNEEGSEAAAATGVAVNLRMRPLPPEEITLNSPFLFFIANSDSAVIFWGRVSNPLLH